MRKNVHARFSRSGHTTSFLTKTRCEGWWG